MQYNSHATSQDLVSLADNLAKSNSVSFPIIEKTQYANLGYRIILSTIHSVYGGWKFDDSNQTDFPRATTNLVSGQDDYALPLDASFVDNVYYQEEGGTTWVKIEPMLQEDFDAEPQDYSTDGAPKYFKPIGNSIKLYPASDFSQDDALMIEYGRDISAFKTTDTTKTPGFDSQFHEAIAIYMAWQYAMTNNTGSVKNLTLQWGDILRRIERHYVDKYKKLFPSKIKVTNKTKQYM